MSETRETRVVLGTGHGENLRSAAERALGALHDEVDKAFSAYSRSYVRWHRDDAAGQDPAVACLDEGEVTFTPVAGKGGVEVLASMRISMYHR